MPGCSRSPSMYLKAFRHTRSILISCSYGTTQASESSRFLERESEKRITPLGTSSVPSITGISKLPLYVAPL